MMYSDEEIKEISEGSFMRPGDEIISIREVCLSDKLDRRDLGLHLFNDSCRNDLDVPRSFRDGFFPESLEQARFAWTEEDGNIASLVSEPGFGTTGQTTFGRQIDLALKNEMKQEPDTSSSAIPSSSSSSLRHNSYGDSQLVSSTSSSGFQKSKSSQGAYKVDKTDPRSRYHFVKYVKRHGRTVRLWECGICGREFQHQYTLMRHLPTHTDERNFHCVACGKSFRQLSTLSQHRAIHSAERPYACEVCNKTFNRVSTLISHRKTHSDDKPYRCHLCPKGFHQKGNLRNHLFTHTNERPYVCNICMKGFNQQSNLVCHKNKAHPEDGSNIVRRTSVPRSTRSASEPKPEQRPQPDCEVTSSVGPYLPPSDNPTPNIPWNISLEPSDPWSNGVIVDQIKTYHMDIAIANKQTPFALLKPDIGGPVLVKVVDASLPGGKQMLVPATAEDLRSGGKIIVKKEDECEDIEVEQCAPIDGAVQIRVPVVATVIPKIKPGGRLHLVVEEPHRSYHTATLADEVEQCATIYSLVQIRVAVVSKIKPGGTLHLAVEEPHRPYHTATLTDAGEVHVEPCMVEVKKEILEPSTSQETKYTGLNTYNKDNPLPDNHLGISSSCSLAPPLSPPLDLIPMDLFENMECMPLGPQITAVGSIDEPPASDDSDIFIGEFEESIQLSDSE